MFSVAGIAVGVWAVVRPLLILYLVWCALRALQGIADAVRTPGAP